MVCYVFCAATECTYGWHRELRPRLASARISDVEVLLSKIDHSIYCLSSTKYSDVQPSVRSEDIKERVRQWFAQTRPLARIPLHQGRRLGSQSGEGH